MSDNLSQIALLNALTTPMSDNLDESRSLTTVKSDNLSIVNIFSDIGVLFLSKSAEYQP